MRYSLLIIAAFYLFTGCKSKNAIPSNVLPQKKMQGVLYDMMRADRFLSDYVLNKDTSLKKKDESIKLYQQVLAINKVTKEKFEYSFDFYKAHPALLKVIMDSIVSIPEPTATIPVVKLPNKDSLKAITDSVSKAKSEIKVDSVRNFKKLKKLSKTIPAKL